MKKLLVLLILIFSFNLSGQTVWQKKSEGTNWDKFISSGVNKGGYLLDDSTTSATTKNSIQFPLSSGYQDFDGAISFTLRVDSVDITGIDDDWVLIFKNVYYLPSIGIVLGDTITWVLSTDATTTDKTITSGNYGLNYYSVNDPTAGVERFPIDHIGMQMTWSDTINVIIWQGLGLR